ncbi:MAG: hypothetical protein KA297_09805 [Kofleriaceae bacterium]|nr:hypothetical protein [Kofleriaceae bacterium]
MAGPARAWALLAVIAALALTACGDNDDGCELEPGADPTSVGRLGCPADYAAMATLRSDSVFSRTETILVIVDREDDDRVYFIDTEKYTLHYEFAASHLDRPGFTAVGDLTAFNLLNYRRPGRRFILGKVVRYLDQALLTFELAAGDTADAELIVHGYEVVRAQLGDGDALRYRPVSADQEDLLPALTARIPTIGTDEVFRGQVYQALNPGVGFGVVRFRRTSTLGGQPLAPTDLVVLDRVPNDVSMVAGIITAEFQTPLAHVGVLAKTRGTPNMALQGAWDDLRLRGFEDQLVRLEVGPQDFTVVAATAAEAQVYWDSLRPSAPQVPAHDSTTRLMFDVTRVTVNEVNRIGAKAANLGELYPVRTLTGAVIPLPDRPLAIPFAFYADHLASSGAGPLIDALLADVGAGTVEPTDLEARLFAIRWTLYRAPVAPALLDLLEPLLAARWPVGTKLRFRSSTNVEDLAEFTGAGLYTSASADVGAAREHLGNAIKTVWASVWNQQAFVERDFYRVDQTQVRMGVLVHPAQQDELANGVVLTINEFSELRPAYYINTQLGAISVTNPTADAVPEQILYYTWYEEPEYEVITRSSLMSWAVDWPSPTALLTRPELDQLADYLYVIQARLRARYPGSAVDVEWKLMPGRQLLIKQARPFKRREVARAAR